ncbi:FAD-binding oxidoreductase [Lysobacter fragariae]
MNAQLASAAATAPGFHRLTIKHVEHLCAGTVVLVEFDVPASLQAAYAYTAGQYVDVRATCYGALLHRSYSLCDEPGMGRWRIAIRHHAGGAFSSHALAHFAPGSTVEVSEPTGRFTPALDPSNARSYVALAAGSGITPILPIIAATLAAEPHSRFRLHYGNRSAGSILFREELEALARRFGERLEIVHYLSRETVDAPGFHSGRIDPTTLPIDADEWFVCGPKPLILSTVGHLRAHGIKAAQVRVELFKSPAPAVRAGEAAPSPSMEPA